MSALASLSNRYATANPARAARVIESLPENEQLAELADLDDSTLAVIFDFFSPAHAGGLFNLLNPDRQGSIINIVQPRLAVVLLAQLDEGERETVMASMGKSERIDLQRQLTYPENSAGRLMDSVFNSCKRSMTVEETLTELRKSRIHRARSLNVIDDENRLVGRVDMQDLALEEPGTAIRAIMYPAEAVLSALDQRERIVELLEQSRLDSLPVVDVQGRLIGAVRYASLFSAIEEVAIAGMQKMVGNPDERALSPMGFAVKKRLRWWRLPVEFVIRSGAGYRHCDDFVHGVRRYRGSRRPHSVDPRRAGSCDSLFHHPDHGDRCGGILFIPRRSDDAVHTPLRQGHGTPPYHHWSVDPSYPGDNVIDRDIVLLWSEPRKVITGSDILRRLLIGITGTGQQQHRYT